MAILKRGQDTSSGDINISFVVSGHNQDPVDVYAALYDVTGPTQILLDNNPHRTPVRYDVGKFYIPYHVAIDAPLGKYLVIWSYKPTNESAYRTECDEWYVVSELYMTSESYTDIEKSAIWNMRIVLRDENPDKFYHFQPPNDEVTIAGFTEKHGYLWTDEELYEFLQLAVQEINMTPPEPREFTLEGIFKQDKFMIPIIKTSAMKWALNAMAINWAGEEFSYSINGVSLDLNKFDKYMQLKQNAEDRYDKMVELYRASVHIIKGIRPSMYTISAGRSGSLSGSTAITYKYLDKLYFTTFEEFYYGNEIIKEMKKGNVFVKSVSINKKVEWKRILDVIKHDMRGVENEKCYNICFGNDKTKITESHCVYNLTSDYITPIKTKDIKNKIVFVENENVIEKNIGLVEADFEQYMYDFSVEDNNNFVAANGLLAHNSGLWLGPSTSGMNPANFIRSLSLSGYNFGYQFK